MRIAAVQFDVGPDVAANLELATDRIRDVADRGADLIVLPEIWNVGYFAFEQYRERAEPIDGPTVTRLREVATEEDVFLHTGSIVERDDGNYYNTSGLIAPDGELLATYRKIHLFGYDSREQQLLTPGDRVVTVDTALGTLGLTTCYDLRFPGLYRALVDAGVELVVVTSAWPSARLEHWTLLTRTRALESQLFLAAANLAGTNAGVDLAGRSRIVDPSGIPIADAGTDPGAAVADIDLETVSAAREEFPVLRDRRIDTEYSLSNP